MKAPMGNAGPSFHVPEGSHAAICTMVIDTGMHLSKGDWGEKNQRKVYMRFEIPGQIIPDGDYEGQPATIGVRKTFSMYKAAKLRGMLEMWRGKPFSDEDADAFDLEKVLGRSGTIQVYLNKNGYDTFDVITPYSGDALQSYAEPIWFDTEDPHNFDELPEWVQRKINLPSAADAAMQDEYADVQARQYEQEQKDTARTSGGTGFGSPSEDDFDDDIPF